MSANLDVAVVTGGHPFDVPNFTALFHRLAGIRPVIQHMDDFASSPEAVRDRYGVVLFYIMLMEGPVDEGAAWYAGKPKSALEHLGATAQGILFLHHAILAYPRWLAWSEMVGIADRKFVHHPDQALRVEVADPDHPITRGLAGWDMPDETYTMAEAGPDSRVLLTAQHPQSMRSLGWVRQHRRNRVFCLQSGHDNATWQNPGFTEVLRRGLFWCAGAA